MNEISKETNDIINQISSYSQEDVDLFTLNMKQELEIQKKLNKILKENDYDENISSINNFIERNGNTVDYQLEELKKITLELEKVVDENTLLKEKYESVLKSKDCVGISEKLKEIKNMKKRMITFLQKAGI